MEKTGQRPEVTKRDVLVDLLRQQEASLVLHFDATVGDVRGAYEHKGQEVTAERAHGMVVIESEEHLAENGVVLEDESTLTYDAVFLAVAESGAHFAWPEAMPKALHELVARELGLAPPLAKTQKSQAVRVYDGAGNSKSRVPPELSVVQIKSDQK